MTADATLEELERRRATLTLDARHDPEAREALRETEAEIARLTAARKEGTMGTDVNERATARDVRDVELDTRAGAGRVPLRNFLEELRGLRQDLYRRARIVGDPSRFGDDVDALEAFLTAQIRAILHGEYPDRQTVADVLGVDAYLGTKEALDHA